MVLGSFVLCKIELYRCWQKKKKKNVFFLVFLTVTIFKPNYIYFDKDISVGVICILFAVVYYMFKRLSLIIREDITQTTREYVITCPFRSWSYSPSLTWFRNYCHVYITVYYNTLSQLQ